jgi:hypothetical protein
MADGPGRFSKARLEAFSDGVIAVIITIMVLDLKAPQSEEPAGLLRLWPSFLLYLVSFTFVAIYWINHHNLLTEARRVTASLIWANNALLFCLRSPRPMSGIRIWRRSRPWFTARCSSLAQWPTSWSCRRSSPSEGERVISWKLSGRDWPRTSPASPLMRSGRRWLLSLRSPRSFSSWRSRWPTSCRA